MLRVEITLIGRIRSFTAKELNTLNVQGKPLYRFTLPDGSVEDVPASTVVRMRISQARRGVKV